MPSLRIVLVEPREAGNVGAAARVMKNFGFGDLRIVGEHPPLQPVSGWWASGADDVLMDARFAPTLLDAIRDAHLTVATTSMRGRTSPLSFTPRTLAEAFACLEDDQILALVFGREDSGLTREELLLCHQTAAIPTTADFPTMNLAQALCVFCYELAAGTAGSAWLPKAPSRASPEGAFRPRGLLAAGSPLSGSEREGDLPTLATAETVERLHRRAKELLLEVGFLNEQNPDRVYEDLRAIAGRSRLDVREATILLGIIRQVEWKIRKGDGGTPPNTRR